MTQTNGARRVVLLGPQRFTPSVTDVRASMGILGPVALITAGWQERESDDDELSRALGGATVNLKLHQRAEDLFRKDRPFAEAYKTRQRRLRDMQDLYRFRLWHALDTARVVSRWNADPDLVAEQRDDAIDLVRRLDTAHVERCREMRMEFESRWKPLERPGVAEHRSEIAARVADCEAVAVAGGHVATLLNRLVLFGIAEMPIRTLFAWSAGAMALTDRVVLFHDDPPQGQGESEVLEEGLGLCPKVVVFPHWRRRLKLEDPERGSLLAKRFEPASCLAMEDGSHVTYDGASYGEAVGVLRIKLDGAIGSWS